MAHQRRRAPGKEIWPPTRRVFYRDPRAPTGNDEHAARGRWQELALVNLIRKGIKDWRDQHWPGVTRTTLELLEYWRRDGRQHRLFFAQREAAETVIFLTEARPDLLQGIDVPMDEPSDERKAEGYRAFRRHACKMATGSGKTTVMGMLAAWSILNKVNDRSDPRFSDVVLIVCPNVTIRNRLGELNPELAEASLYRTRDLVPEHLMPFMTRGRVLVMNWHVFEPQSVQVGGVGARVSKAGRAVRVREKITIGDKTTNARGIRYLTLENFQQQVGAGLIEVLEEERERDGTLKKVVIESSKYVESDTALLNRILGREVGGKQNILVMNDEAHHAYRIRKPEPEEGEEDMFGDDEADEFFKEATVWIDGLDRIHKLRGINFCVDLSATPYYLGRVGQDTNRTFPWVVSDFGLIDAIESGLTKIPQLAVRDNTGADIPGYFNIWHWILRRLRPGQRGGRRAEPQPEAILTWAHTPIAMLGGLWEQLRQEWARSESDPRPPVFILVCKNTKLAKVIYEWLAENNAPTGIASAHLDELRIRDGVVRTIRVDSKVVHESDSDEVKSDEVRWMRLTLDTVGKVDWPKSKQGQSIYPEGFEELAAKLKRPLHPPGRDIRCIVSVGMLTEGWDCNTVTHIVGLRPFMSQLLCEQVVGRGLRRSSYDVDEATGLLREEVAKIFGVPFEVIPFKTNTGGGGDPPVKRNHVHAIPQKQHYEIRFPRVAGYRQTIRNSVIADWDSVATLELDPMKIPPQVQMAAGLPSNTGRFSVISPGGLVDVNLNPYREGQRLQALVFEMARDLTREYCGQASCEAPPHVLFPQIAKIVERYLHICVKPIAPANIYDSFLSPYYGWIIERLRAAIRPDTWEGESPELPLYERHRGPGSTAEIDFWTSKDVVQVEKSHLNFLVADSNLERAAVVAIDSHENVAAFVKNAGLGFAIPYLDNGQGHDYVPDFIIRLRGGPERYLILETKGYDPIREVKAQAARRWVDAVNADGAYGRWDYKVVVRGDDRKGLLAGMKAETASTSLV
ncbi:MAG: BPTD_3080 family restriction endonuclease [Burkholderiales bacterium]